MKSYFTKLMAAISQMGNTLAGGNPDETISARVYHNREKWPRAYRLINKVFFWQSDHCHASAYTDYENAQRVLKKWK